MEGGVSITFNKKEQQCRPAVDAFCNRGDRLIAEEELGRGDFCKRAIALPRAILPARSSRAMASYGVPPALGVAPEMMEEISTGVRARSSPVHAFSRARSRQTRSKAPPNGR